MVVTWATGFVKKIKGNLSPKMITGLVVPLLAFLVAVLDNFLLDANFIWTFVLGMAAIAIYELKKNFISAE